MTKKDNKAKIIALVEAGVMLALATVLSLIPLSKMPFGGSVTLFSMLPIAIYSYRWIKQGSFGVLSSIGVAVVYSIIQLLLGLENFSYVNGLGSYAVVAVFDYILAFGVLCLGGIFRGKNETFSILFSAVSSAIAIVVFTLALMLSGDDEAAATLKKFWWIIVVEAAIVLVLTVLALIFKNKVHKSGIALAAGITLACVLRAISHIISGITVWAGYAPDGAAVAYSLYYNLSYMIPESVITVVIAVIACAIIDFDAQTLNVRMKTNKGN